MATALVMDFPPNILSYTDVTASASVRLTTQM
jgi:hypothetical protein